MCTIIDFQVNKVSKQTVNVVFWVKLPALNWDYDKI